MADEVSQTLEDRVLRDNLDVEELQLRDFNDFAIMCGIVLFAIGVTAFLSPWISSGVTAALGVLFLVKARNCRKRIREIKEKLYVR